MYNINVLSIEDTIKYIIENKSSIARFGDGELDIIKGNSIPYQKYDKTLAKRLEEILFTPSNSKLVVGISDVFNDLNRYNDYAKEFWQNRLPYYEDILKKMEKNTWYGNTFISRPYIDLRDKSQAHNSFKQLKELWNNRDILIVEGKLSRSGVGNDLFDNAKSIQRIIAPSHDSYSRYEEILWLTKYHAKGKLVLLMLGPTAKLLAQDLSNFGVQAIDIGHIDSEYEWFKMGATSKVKLSNKHTSEHNFDEDIVLENDSQYNRQIIVDVSNILKNTPKPETKAIVLACDAGYLMPLSATLKSIFANGYHGTVYIMNSDIPQEWFEIVNNKLKHGNVCDVKISQSLLKEAPKSVIDATINYMTYARLFAPDMIPVDKLLYIDSDVVIDNDIETLINMDLKGHIVGAVTDYRDSKIGFLAGVLLIDAKKWRKGGYTEKIWSYALKQPSLRFGDQGLLNDFFKDNYYKLENKYNYELGAFYMLFYNQANNYVENEDVEKVTKKLENISNPTAYHYTTMNKPWIFATSQLYREKWWKYYSLDWDKLKKVQFEEKFHKKIFIFTSSDELRDIEILVKNFKNIQFNIASYVNMSFKLLKLVQFKNVKLYPAVIGLNINKLICESEVMLDITNGPDFEITKEFAKTRKPIIGYREDKFKGVISEDDYVLVHSKEEMIEKINELERL